ncbi:4'-phosphopantetheinyl transferase family protein [Actinoplanes derwentensis]|uniref:4'-phosphopantetheinyl transferase EntD (Siderophore biosynthesis) n=1 Tax=Actinoplanes derwentensis TaxID=113562 RepID=A0A1H1RB75_9ACTN|nr:4'-phosphopantetheinyl transferase superfamily protein [Actinoplanes derwentensis]GID88064.1 4'-phosphopantetheinyl transferase [Actinoplanes derwentensis]SDS33027.1 4'-phosphopantetheinyl transferase EntD (siderophore biosynthesis) [Actinoplanes derwentensis]
MLADLLPPGVRCAVAFDDGTPAPLFPEELVLVAGSTAERRREYATVRMCARRALAELGRPPVAIVRGPGGAPRWPAGIVGSLTHCRGFRGAAVAESTATASLGIDAEPAGALPDGVLGLITSAAERDDLARLTAVRADLPWDRLLFCAKEAFYKAWFPLTGRWLGFRDAVVTIEPDGRFTAVPVAAQPGEPRMCSGRWGVHDDLLLATVAVPAGVQPRPGAPADVLPCR